MWKNNDTSCAQWNVVENKRITRNELSNEMQKNGTNQGKKPCTKNKKQKNKKIWTRRNKWKRRRLRWNRWWRTLMERQVKKKKNAKMLQMRKNVDIETSPKENAKMQWMRKSAYVKKRTSGGGKKKQTKTQTKDKWKKSRRKKNFIKALSLSSWFLICNFPFSNYSLEQKKR